MTITAGHTPLNYEESSLAQLQQLITLRAILIIALLGAYLTLLYSGIISIDHIPVLALTGPIIALTLFNFYSYWQISQHKYISHRALFFQLAADIIALSTVLYYTGGSTNPFVSYFLVPITLSAAALPFIYTVILISAAALIYYVQLYYFEPFSLFSNPHEHMHHGASSAHFTGMWINFLFSACLIGVFLQRMQSIVQQKNAALREAETQLHRNEQLFALGTLAAGTAHQLGTPLNTMLILVQELENDEHLPKQACEDLSLIRSQIESCKAILQNLKQTESALAPSVVDLKNYMSELISSINIVRPDKLATLDSPYPNTIQVQRDITLDQAIMNLLNNALDESASGNVHVELDTDQVKAIVLIKQQKRETSRLPQPPIGATPFSTKPEGMGIGIMLTFSSLKRLGGSAEFIEDENTITTKIVLPLKS
ncbi:MAG TPA: histidine kinase dimerization/phospho-acceptor domain-containing protein [Pseudomonadales bacterium]|nr:histidine kinase dimerization/phospho-acceptor domain-containing protein [Pseudomonadales bacterium]